MRDRIATLDAKRKTVESNRSKQAKLAAKVFKLSQGLEHSQGLEQQWLASKYTQKRQILETVCLNFRLDNVTLVPEMRKPFSMLAEGLLVSSSRGDKTPVELFMDYCAENAVSSAR